MMLIAAKKIKRDNDYKLIIKKYSMMSENKEETIQKGIDMDNLYFMPNDLKLKTISFLRVPKLDWDDRRIELR